MNKKEIFNHYSKVIDDLLENSMYFQTYFQRPYYLENNIDGEDYENIPDNISLHDGATRCCIIDYDYDWVVKFNIEDNKLVDNVCKYEEEIYSAAKERNLDQYLCEMGFIGTYTKTYTFYDINDIESVCTWYGYDENEFDEEIMAHEDEMNITSVTISIPLYAYRRADYYDFSNLDEELIGAAQKITSPLRENQIAIATAFIQEYGFEQYQAFSEFAEEYDINDIHTGNIGAINNKIIIIDWGSYYE